MNRGVLGGTRRGLGPNVVPAFSFTGTLSVLTGTYRWYNDTGASLAISKVRASVGTAPTGSPVILDLRLNGTSAFTNTTNRPTIPIAGNTATAIPDVVVVNDGDYLTVDVVQVGSTTA